MSARPMNSAMACCPSCMGRRMAEGAALLVDHVLPAVGYRQWVLSFQGPMAERLGYDQALLARVAEGLPPSPRSSRYSSRSGPSGANTGGRRAWAHDPRRRVARRASARALRAARRSKPGGCTGTRTAVPARDPELLPLRPRWRGRYGRPGRPPGRRSAPLWAGMGYCAGPLGGIAVPGGTWRQRNT